MVAATQSLQALDACHHIAVCKSRLLIHDDYAYLESLHLVFPLRNYFINFIALLISGELAYLSAMMLKHS